MTAENLTVLCFALSQLFIFIAGACLITSALIPSIRKFAMRFFLLGILAAFVAVYGPIWLPNQGY